jgi:hypothetical protein
MNEVYISTTAGGDGLEFDKRLPSIYEEIREIKGEKIPSKPPLKNDHEGITLEEVA